MPRQVITAGETMALAVPPSPGRLRHATSLSLSIGGAESNVAIVIHTSVLDERRKPQSFQLTSSRFVR